MSRIVNVSLAGPGSFALTRVLVGSLVAHGYSVNAGETAFDVIVPERGCDKVQIVNQLDVGMIPVEVKVDAKEALAALESVEIALAVINSPHSSSDAIDKANAVLLAAMTTEGRLDMTCEADPVADMETVRREFRFLCASVLEKAGANSSQWAEVVELARVLSRKYVKLPGRMVSQGLAVAGLTIDGKSAQELYGAASAFLRNHTFGGQ